MKRLLKFGDRVKVKSINRFGSVFRNQRTPSNKVVVAIDVYGDDQDFEVEVPSDDLILLRGVKVT